MKRVMQIAVLLIAVMAVAATSVYSAVPGWDRVAVVDYMREVFSPLESLMRVGDELDYDRLYFFSGWLNGSWENVIIIPLTYESSSFIRTKNLGVEESWADLGAVPMYAFYVLPPQESFRDLKADTPYFAFASGWDTAYVIDSSGEMVRDIEIQWLRGAEGVWAMEYLIFRGNMVVHGRTCGELTTNQQ